MIIGIDIGTSNSSACYLNEEGKPESINIGTGMSLFGNQFMLPSAVFVEEDGSVLVGQAAMNSRLRNPRNFCAEFKRYLGETVPFVLGGRNFLPDDLYTELFKHIRTCAEGMGSGPIERSCITYPAAYKRNKLAKIESAAAAAGLFHIELLDEPTAAAMHFLGRGLLKNNQTLLVYDFGGGTFDVSLMKLESGRFISLASPRGLEHCGGIDMDRAIYADIQKYIDENTRKALMENPLHRLRTESQMAEFAVKAKQHLSSSELFQDAIPVGFNLVEYSLSRDAFNAMISTLVQQTIECCHQMINDAGISVEDLDAVLLIGGTSHVPLVRQMVAQFCKDVPVLSNVNPELAVSQGAVMVTQNAPAKQEQRARLVQLLRNVETVKTKQQKFQGDDRYESRGQQRPEENTRNKPSQKEMTEETVTMADYVAADDERLDAYARFNKQKDYTLQLLKSGKDILASMPDFSVYAKQLGSAKDKLEKSTFKVMVLGQFKVGKSTFINSLLGDEVLPSDIVPCTAVINEVKWSEHKKAVLHFKDPLPESMPEKIPEHIVRHIERYGRMHVPAIEVNVSNLNQYVIIPDPDKVQSKALSQNIYSKVELYWPLDLCKNSVEIIDSPGLNEDPERTKVTVDYLRNADAVLFVMGLPYVAGQNEVEFMDQYLLPLGHKYSLFICTKIDTIRQSERERLKTNSIGRLKGKTAFEDKGVFFVSAIDALDGKLDHNMAMIQRSGMLEVEELLAHYLTEYRGKMKLMPAITDLDRNVREVGELIGIKKRDLSQSQQEIQKRYTQAYEKLSIVNTKKERLFRRISDKKDLMENDVAKKAAALMQQIAQSISGWVSEAKTHTEIKLFGGSPKAQVESLTDELKTIVDEKIANEQKVWASTVLLDSLNGFMKNLNVDIAEDVRDLLADLENIRINTAKIEMNEVSTGVIKPNTSVNLSPVAARLTGTQIGASLIGVAGIAVATAALVGIAASLPIVIPGAAIAYALKQLFTSSSLKDLWANIRDIKIKFVENKVKEEFIKAYTVAIIKNKDDQAQQVAEKIVDEMSGHINEFEDSISLEVEKVKKQIEAALNDSKLEKDELEAKKASLDVVHHKMQQLAQKSASFAASISLPSQRSIDK